MAVAFCWGILRGSQDNEWAKHEPKIPTGGIDGTVTRVIVRGGINELVIRSDRHWPYLFRSYTRTVMPGIEPGAHIWSNGPFRRVSPVGNPSTLSHRQRANIAHVKWEIRGTLRLLRPSDSPWRFAYGLHLAARSRLDQISQPYGASVLTGLLLGDRGSVPKSGQEALSATGAGHLLAVSGLHVGGSAACLAWFVLLTARVLRSVNPYGWAVIAVVPAVLLMLAVSQNPLSAQRAAIMTLYYLLGRACGMKTHPLDVVGLSALMALWASPTCWTGPSFQLSFGVVTALVLWGSRMKGWRGAWESTWVASLASAPLQVHHFGSFSPVSPIANFVLTPFTALVIVPSGFLGLILGSWGEYLLEFAAFTAEFMVATSEILGAAAGGEQIVGSYSSPWVALPLMLWVTRRHLTVTARLVWVSLLLCLGFWGRPYGTTIEFLSVGQGDAILIQSKGSYALVDAGPDPLARSLTRHLHRSGVRKLKWVLVTHLHPDHFAGLADLSNTIEIGEVLFNGRRSTSREWIRLRRTMLSKKIPMVATLSHRRRFGESTLDFIAPGGVQDHQLRENDASVALRIEADGMRALLTGDLEAHGEKRLIRHQIGPVELLKLGHHGSRTSSTPAFLESICPSAGVITSGYQNRYGLPHAEVIKRSSRRGISLWRTDQDGWIEARLSPASSSEIRSLNRIEKLKKNSACGRNPGIDKAVRSNFLKGATQSLSSPVQSGFNGPNADGKRLGHIGIRCTIDGPPSNQVRMTRLDET